MTREEELRLMDEFIKKTGVTILPKGVAPDPTYVQFSAWGRRKKKKAEKKKKTS